MRLSDTLEKPEVSSFLRKQSAAKIEAENDAFKTVAYCASPGCSNLDYSWCHVLASSSQLANISDDERMVCWIPSRERDRWKFDSFWMREHPNNTLVFRGFCSNCDDKIFKNIDQPIDLNEETYCLLAYRSISYKIWRFSVDDKTYELLPNKIRKIFGRDPLATEVEEIGNHRRSIVQRRNEVERISAQLREEIENEKYSALQSITFDLGEDIPIRYSVAHSFTYDLRCQEIVISREACPQIPMYFMHLLKIGNTTKLIFSWMEYVPSEYPQLWKDLISVLSKNGHLADVLLRNMFVNNHGLVFSPDFEKTLNVENSQFLSAPLTGSFYLNEPVQITRICYPPYFNFDWKAEIMV